MTSRDIWHRNMESESNRSRVLNATNHTRDETSSSATSTDITQLHRSLPAQATQVILLRPEALRDTTLCSTQLASSHDSNYRLQPRRLLLRSSPCSDFFPGSASYPAHTETNTAANLLIGYFQTGSSASYWSFRDGCAIQQTCTRQTPSTIASSLYAIASCAACDEGHPRTDHRKSKSMKRRLGLLMDNHSRQAILWLYGCTSNAVPRYWMCYHPIRAPPV